MALAGWTVGPDLRGAERLRGTTAAAYPQLVTKWADKFRNLDDRILGPVRQTNTDADWWTGHWMYLVGGRALALTLLMFFGGIGVVIGLLALVGVSPNRLVGAIAAAIIGPAVWNRYTRRRYKDRSPSTTE
jgi:Flp pilus assembly protein TadB